MANHTLKPELQSNTCGIFMFITVNVGTYISYTLPHGTPTWDNFRGDETRKDMNLVPSGKLT